MDIQLLPFQAHEKHMYPQSEGNKISCDVRPITDENKQVSAEQQAAGGQRVGR